MRAQVRAQRRRLEFLRVVQELHWVLVFIATGVFLIALCFVKPDGHLSDIAAALFSAAGTIVALGLPAAELAGNAITRVGEYWVNRFANPEKRTPNKKRALREIQRVKEKAHSARRGSIYVLGAFILAAFAMLTPQAALGTLRLAYVLVALSCGLLLVGSVLFFPFAWFVYRLDALQDAEDAILNYSEQKIVAPPPTEIDPVASADKAAAETDLETSAITSNPHDG